MVVIYYMVTDLYPTNYTNSQDFSNKQNSIFSITSRTITINSDIVKKKIKTNNNE